MYEKMLLTNIFLNIYTNIWNIKNLNKQNVKQEDMPSLLKKHTQTHVGM